MKCSEFEKMIYLFNELDNSEKRKLEGHLSTCASCSALFAQLRKDQGTLSEVLKQVPDKFKNENPFLTSRIMSSIEKENARSTASIIEQFIPAFGFRPLKYALAAVSFALLVLFIVQVDPVSKTQQAVSIYKQMPIRKTVQMNSSAFREKIKNSIRNDQVKEASSFSFADCLKDCRDNQNNNCEECVSRFNKIKQNEGI